MGLRECRSEHLPFRSRGGTILGTTNRGNPFKFPIEENGKTVIQDCSHRCLEGMKKLGIEAMVVIGGDGTLSIANDFAKIAFGDKP